MLKNNGLALIDNKELNELKIEAKQIYLNVNKFARYCFANSDEIINYDAIMENCNELSKYCIEIENGNAIEEVHERFYEIKKLYDVSSNIQSDDVVATFFEDMTEHIINDMDFGNLVKRIKNNLYEYLNFLINSVTRINTLIEFDICGCTNLNTFEGYFISTLAGFMDNYVGNGYEEMFKTIIGKRNYSYKNIKENWIDRLDKFDNLFEEIPIKENKKWKEDMYEFYFKRQYEDLLNSFKKDINKKCKKYNKQTFKLIQIFKDKKEYIENNIKYYDNIYENEMLNNRKYLEKTRNIVIKNMNVK